MDREEYYKKNLEFKQKNLEYKKDRQKQLSHAQKVAQRNRNISFIEGGGPVLIVMLLLVFVGVSQFVFVKMGISTLLGTREVNGWTFYYFDVFNYLKNITANVDLIKNIPNNVYSNFVWNDSSIINVCISILNSVIALLNLGTVGTSLLIQFLPLISALYGFAGGAMNFLTDTAQMMSSFHIPYIPYL